MVGERRRHLYATPESSTLWETTYDYRAYAICDGYRQMAPRTNGQSIFRAVGRDARQPNAPWGLLGVSLGWALGYLATFFIILHRSCAATKLRQTEVLSVLGKAVMPAATMYAAVMGLSEFLSPNTSPLFRLLALVGTGVIVHSIAAWVLTRAEVSELMELLRKPRQ